MSIFYTVDDLRSLMSCWVRFNGTQHLSCGADAHCGLMQFTEGQLKPAAQTFANNADKVAEQATEQGIKPAAQAIAERAVPAAEQLTEGQIKPAAQAIANNVRPRTCPDIRCHCACLHVVPAI